MGNSISDRFIFQNRALKNYFLLSMSAGALVILGLLQNTTLEDLFLKYPLSLSFIGLTSIVNLTTRPWRAQVAVSSELVKFFLIQYCLLLGMAFELQVKELLLMASLPIVSSLYMISGHWFWSGEDKRVKTYGVVFVVFCSLPLPLYSLSLEFNGQIDLGWCYLAFFSWQLGLFFIAGNRRDKGQNSVLEERYFFHDAINHTHGLSLYFKNKIIQGNDLKPEEMMSVLSEIQSWQDLMHSHFGMGHKNLNPLANIDLKELGLINEDFKRINSYYFDPEVFPLHFHYKGLFKEHDFLFKEIKLSGLPLLRIYTNLIKNCSEAHSRQIEVIQECTYHEYKLTLKNEIPKAKNTGYDLSKTLEKKIASDLKNSTSGYGLESIESLVGELKGEFHFHWEGNIWVSEITIPHHSDLSHLNKDILSKSPKSDKKVA